MKRIIIFAAIAMLLFLAARITFKTMNEVDDEMEAYVRNLHYNFGARVDSIEILNPKRKYGFLVCDLSKGKVNELTEDSLNRHLIEHKRIRFLFFQPDHRFKIFLWDVSKNESGDSVSIISDRNEFKILEMEKLYQKEKLLNQHFTRSVLPFG